MTMILTQYAFEMDFPRLSDVQRLALNLAQSSAGSLDPHTAVS